MADVGDIAGKGVVFLDQFGNLQLDWAVFFERVAADCYWQELQKFTVANLPTANVPVSAMAFCTDEVGGAVPVYWDGSNWLRVTDRAVATT